MTIDTKTPIEERVIESIQSKEDKEDDLFFCKHNSGKQTRIAEILINQLLKEVNARSVTKRKDGRKFVVYEFNVSSKKYSFRRKQKGHQVYMIWGLKFHYQTKSLVNIYFCMKFLLKQRF